MALSKSAENNFDDYYMIIDLYEGNLPIVRNHRMQVKDSLMLIYKKHPEMIQNGIEMDCTKMCFDRNNRTDQYLIYLFSSIDKSLSDLLDFYEEYYHGHYTFRIDRPNNFNGILVHKLKEEESVVEQLVQNITEGTDYIISGLSEKLEGGPQNDI